MSTSATAVRQLSARVISEATGASLRTAKRWRAGTMPRRRLYRLRLDEVAAILDTLGTSLSPRGRQAWLTSRSAHLGSQRPVELLAAGAFDEVRGAALAYTSGDPT
ncbi:MAG TPA: hypothetical protein VK838_04690 [Candidatus Limnocylindrales bacterium]|nr:hypothetical protein [Candidatus Limnocylindrales bacterium]